MEWKDRVRFDRGELAGALGDLGTFIPLLVGMVQRCGLALGPALFFAGFMNVLTGLAFGIPMPVQPMKVIAAVAIAEGLSANEIAAAGILTGAVILVLGTSGLIVWLNRTIPRSVVRGLQLAVGLKLLGKGLSAVAGTGVWIGWDSRGLGVLCFVAVLLLYSSRRMPGALIVFAVGLVTLLAGRPDLLFSLGFGFEVPSIIRFSHDDWLTGLWRGAIPQIPLTTLNSVIAVCALSIDLFPHRPASPRRVALSVALMNLACCPFGAMPMCHGAGGLASQYRFGGRTGGSVVMLGGAKMLLALAFGSSLLVCLQAFPQSVLGVLLVFGGLELSLVCRDQKSGEDFFVMLLTAGACLALNVAAGFAVGWAIAALLLTGVVRLSKDSDGKR